MEYKNNREVHHAIDFPVLPNVICTIDIRLVSPFSSNETSNNSKAVKVIIQHVSTKIISVGQKPAAAVVIGNPSIPAPIDVPAIKNAPPLMLPT